MEQLESLWGMLLTLLIARAELPLCLSSRRGHGLPGWLLQLPTTPPCPSATASMFSAWSLLCGQQHGKGSPTELLLYKLWTELSLSHILGTT